MRKELPVCLSQHLPIYTMHSLIVETLNGHSLTCIKNKCVMNSRVYSAIKLAAKKLHDFLHVTKKVDAFVVPSLFTLQKLNR